MRKRGINGKTPMKRQRVNSEKTGNPVKSPCLELSEFSDSSYMPDIPDSIYCLDTEIDWTIPEVDFTEIELDWQGLPEFSESPIIPASRTE